MSFYISRIALVEDRKCPHIYSFIDNDIYFNDEKSPLYHAEINDKMRLVLWHAQKNNIEEFEIYFPYMSVGYIKKVLHLFSTFLLKHDEYSIGLLFPLDLDPDMYYPIFEQYGLMIPDPSLYQLKCRPMKVNMRRRFEEHEAAVFRCSKPVPHLLEAKAKVEINLDLSFHDLLMRYLVECNKDNVEVYRDGGLTRQAFSRIISDKEANAKKDTVICLCIGMELNYADSVRLLNSAGYTLSKSILLDAIVAKNIKECIYDLDVINTELDEAGERCLGWRPRN